MLETIKTENLKPHPNNEEMWGELEVKELAETIRLSGQVTPLLVSRRANGDQFVLGGNRRLKAAISLGLQELDCRVLDGITQEQERDHLFWDNHANRELGGGQQLRAALFLMETVEGTQKQKIQILCDKTGYSAAKSKAIFAKASSLLKQANLSPDTKDEVLKKAVASAEKHGLHRTKTKSERSSENKKSIPTAANREEKTVKSLSCPRCVELEAKVAELEETHAKRVRRMEFLLDSFGDNEAWRGVLTYMDQKISLPIFNKHISAGKPHPDRRIRLDIWRSDLHEHILHDYFFLYCNGQPVEQTHYVDVVEDEPDEDFYNQEELTPDEPDVSSHQ